MTKFMRSNNIKKDKVTGTGARQSEPRPTAVLHAISFRVNTRAREKETMCGFLRRNTCLNVFFSPSC